MQYVESGNNMRLLAYDATRVLHSKHTKETVNGGL